MRQINDEAGIPSGRTLANYTRLKHHDTHVRGELR